jgi:hypothetical protein
MTRLPYLDTDERVVVFRELARKVEAGEPMNEIERVIVATALRGLAAGVAPGVTFQRNARKGHGPATAERKIAAAEATLARLAEIASRRPLRATERRQKAAATKERTRGRQIAREAYRAAWRRGEIGRHWLLTAADVEIVIAEIISDPLSGMTPEVARQHVEVRHAADVAAFQELTGWSSPPVDNDPP